MALIRAKTCANCAYSDKDGRSLICRFNPPAVTPILVPGQQGPQVLGHVASWPPVGEDAWCGQWRTRIETSIGAA